MPLRALAPTVALAVVGAALPAGAVTRLACPMIDDDRGDAAWISPVPVPGAPGDDLLSADVASDGRTLTAVLRLAALPRTDPQAPLGRQYALQFTVGQDRDARFLRARVTPTGTSFAYGYTTATLPSEQVVQGAARGVVDEGRKEVRIHAPVSGYRLHLGRGSRLTRVQAVSARLLGQDAQPQVDVAGTRADTGGTVLVFDQAEGRSYVLGARSCVRVGR